jgi:hypothetical protein
VINQLRLKLIAAATLAGTAITIMNTSPPTAAAGFRRDGTRSHVSAPLVHSPPKNKLKSHHETVTPALAHVKNSGTEIVVLKPGGNLWEIGKEVERAHETDLPLGREVNAIINANQKPIDKAGGVDRLSAGLKVIVPIKSKPQPTQVHQTQPSGLKPETRRFVLEHGDSLYEIGKEVERDHETNLPLGREVKAIISANQKPINEAGGVNELPVGMVIEAPIDRNPPPPPVAHGQSQEQKLKTQQELEIQEFKTYFKERHGETWAGSPNAALKVGDTLLYEDSKTHEFKIGRVEHILGEGAERILVADNGVSAISHVIEIGDLPSISNQPKAPEQPKESAAAPPPSEAPPPSDRPVWAINIDPSSEPIPPPLEVLPKPQVDNSLISHNAAPVLTPTTIPNPPKAPSSSEVFKPIIDYSKTPPNMWEVVANGDVAVFRYVGYPGEGEKLLTPAEVVRDHNAGLPIGLFFEAGARDALGGYAEGVKDGAQALKDELALGVPKYVVTYFAADFDPSEKDLVTINEYLAGEESVFVKKGGYTDGEYGGYSAVTSALKSGRVKWVVQTYAWDRERGWVPGAQIRQYANHRIVAGTTVDLDKATTDAIARMWQPTKTPDQMIASATPSTTHSLTPPKAPTPSATPTPTPSNSQPVTTPNQIQSFIDNPSNIASNPTTPKSDTNAQVYKFFNSNGLTAFAAAGIAANANAESGSQPERLQGTPSGDKISINSLSNNQLNDPKIGYGAFQFTPPEKFLVWANAANLDPNSLITQCKYVLAGMNPNLIQELNAAPSAATAARIFERMYERPASLSDAGRRASIAKKLYTRMNSSASPFSALTP